MIFLLLQTLNFNDCLSVFLADVENLLNLLSSSCKSCPAPRDPMGCSTPAFPVLCHRPGFAQTHVCWVSDAIQSSHPLLPPSLPALNLSHHQDLFQWISSLHQVAKVLELQLQHKSFQWVFRFDFLKDWLVYLLEIKLYEIKLLKIKFYEKRISLHWLFLHLTVLFSRILFLRDLIEMQGPQRERIWGHNS